jgi:HlyD family secretion protein
MPNLRQSARLVLRARYFVPVFILVAAVAGWGAVKKQADRAKAERYRTAEVDRGPLQQRITANGTLNPVTVVNVGTQVSGTVTRLYTDFNQPVTAGQILAELDQALIRASIGQIEANLKSAEATQRLADSALKRNRELVGKGFISPATLEQNQKELEVASAQVAQVAAQLQRERTNLAYTVIRSPINGTVVDRKVDVGQTVAASFNTPTLFQIAKDLEKMQIDTSVAEADVGRLRDGMPVRFTVDAFPDRDFEGRIRMVRLNPTIQQNVVTYNVIVDVDNSEKILKPGMTAQVSMVVATRTDAVRIPNAALRFRPSRDDKEKDRRTSSKEDAQTSARPVSAQGSEVRRKPPARVYKVDAHGELQAVEVQTGVASNQFTELVSGALSVGDKLVVRDTLDKNPKK